MIEKMKKRVFVFGLCSIFTLGLCACSKDNEDDTADMVENQVLPAYQEYIDANVDEFNGCELIYIDNDEIPECVYRNYTVAVVLTYNDGKVVEVTGTLGSSGISYRERTGEFMLSELAGSHYIENYYTLENGEFVLAAYLTHADYGNDEEEFFYMEGESYESIDEEKYNEYKASFGTYDNSVDYKYSSVNEAYDSISK